MAHEDMAFEEWDIPSFVWESFNGNISAMKAMYQSVRRGMQDVENAKVVPYGNSNRIVFSHEAIRNLYELDLQ